jgi:hypothetical protein
MTAASSPDAEDHATGSPGAPAPGPEPSAQPARGALAWQPTIAALISSLATVVIALITSRPAPEATDARPQSRPYIASIWTFTEDGVMCFAAGVVLDPRPESQVQMYSTSAKQQSPPSPADVGVNGNWSTSWPCSGHNRKEDWIPLVVSAGKGDAGV